MSSIEDDARQALRSRLGKGARYDAPTAPSRALALARLGTAYFARKLNQLRGEDLDQPSLVPGWSRRHVVAHIGFHARGLARVVESARMRRSAEVLDEPEAQNEDIHLGATLPDHALRHLFSHSQVHLNVEWRDLDEIGWNASVRSLAGDFVSVSETPWLRAKEIWLRSVDLDNGGSFLDFPPALIDRMLGDIAVAPENHHASLILRPVDRPDSIFIGKGEQTVSGQAADLLRWITGRGARRLVGDTLPEVGPSAGVMSLTVRPAAQSTAFRSKAGLQNPEGP